jgi:DNA segregation ATPase FtsK/SpoIIIE, S-DNA-T family
MNHPDDRQPHTTDAVRGEDQAVTDQHDHDDQAETGERNAKVYRLPNADQTPADQTPADRTPGDHTSAESAEVIVGEIVTDGPDTRQLVDSPQAQRGPSWWEQQGSSKRRPVLPQWARSPEEFRAAARWTLGHIAHASLYHALRCPIYVARLLARTPRGAVRMLTTIARWVFDTEGIPVRLASVRREDAETYLRLSRQRDIRVRARGVLLGLGLAVALPVVIVGWTMTPTWAHVAALAVLVGVLGSAGSPADKPLLDTAVVATKVQKLTSDIVIRALAALGIAEINKAMGKGGSGVTFPAPITRDGPGWRAEVDLPYGVTATDIIERRDKLASGLRRPLGCVWPEPASDAHAGRLVLWVGDEDMNTAKPRPWPLARHGRTDLFQPVPFGTDPRGRLVSVLLMFASVLIGAMPRQGKTVALRVLLLAAALDVVVELRVFELKGTGDLSALEKVAYHYASGADDASVEATLASLREMAGELERRSKVIRELPATVCPDRKITPHLAGRKDLGLHPVVFAVDECQELFSHPDYGKEAGELATRVIKLGPAMGIILLLATQRPDAKSLPTGVSDNVGIRFCLRVMGQQANDMVLGTSSYQNGVRATMFGPRDKGIGLLVGNADEPQTVRSAYLDAPAADRIADRARGLRQAVGRLSGHATGDDTRTTLAAAAADTLLEDVLAVVGADEAKAWNDTVVSRLADYRPEAYGHWQPDQLTAALKPYGIRTGQVWGTDEHGDGRNRRGITRDHIATALTERNRKHPAG